CAETARGILHCWGDGHFTPTGHGSVAGVRDPEPVPGLAGVVGWTFAQKSWNGKDAVYAWLRDGRLLACGHNSVGWDDDTRGQLGWVAPSRIEEPQRVVER